MRRTVSGTQTLQQMNEANRIAAMDLIQEVIKKLYLENFLMS